MKYYGTKDDKNYGFYEENFENSIELTDEYWKELLQEQNNGKMIIHYNGTVIAVNSSEYEFQNNEWVKLTREEIAKKDEEKQKQKRIKEIGYELENLDKKRIRAIAEPSMKDEDISWLEFYNNQIKILREELGQLNN